MRDLRDWETAQLIEQASDQALAFMTADPILQQADQQEVTYALGGILRMAIRNGDRNPSSLATMAVKKLRDRETIKDGMMRLRARHAANTHGR